MKKHEKNAKVWFSRLVRLKGCLNTTGGRHYGICFTCGANVPISDLQCGHFVSGRTNALFFEEHNSHIQCTKCNTFLGGNLEVYREKMIEKYGIEEVERFESLRHTVQRISSPAFSFKFNNYKRQYLDLVNNC